MIKNVKKILKVFLIPLFLAKAFMLYLPSELFGLRLRRFYYKNKFFSCGSLLRIQEGCNIHFPHLIQVGSNCIIGRGVELSPGPGEAPCLIIGDNTGIGPYSYFRTANHRFDDPNQLFATQGHNEKKIIVGSDIYMGAHCIILAGANIGDHSVIAAGSVVSTTIPPYSVVAGNPARIIRRRETSSSEEVQIRSLP